MTPRYRCPVCTEPLDEGSSGFSCVNRHQFDRARDGYVNLLPGGRLKGRPPGDSESMIAARRTVFDAGLYGPIIDAVAERVHASVAGAAEPPAVLDCGCGEGSYLAEATRRSGAGGWGVDISKAAVRTAARRHRDERFAVASSYALPFDDATFDVVLSVFSPRPFAEMMRVLAPGGTALLVTPGAEHLHQIKELVYDDPRPHTEPTGDAGIDADENAQENAQDSAQDRWQLPPRDVATVRFDIRLDEPRLRTALLEMTPFWWSAPPDRQRRIADLASVVTVDMRLSAYSRSE